MIKVKSVAAKFRYRLAVGNSCHASYTYLNKIQKYGYNTNSFSF
nr:MAG TPA: hypothetical protein [Caudoviricetes sp.]